MADRLNQNLRTLGVVVLAGAAAGVVATLLVRNQMVRHQRGLFSPHAFQRLAALGHMARAEASVDRINLLRDFMVWETRPILRSRARAILERMESEAHAGRLSSASGAA